MNRIANDIAGYTYGTAEAPPSRISLEELNRLKASAGFTDEDARSLRVAGDVLKDQTKQIVDHWRVRIIGGIPHLAKHSRTPEGDPIPEYSARSGLRFEQWILDTCFRDYDQDWLNYQQEIAARHTTVKKNQTDSARSTAYVPLPDIIAFVAVMNQTIRPYLESKGHTRDDVDKMHNAWCKSLHLQVALWSIFYLETR